MTTSLLNATRKTTSIAVPLVKMNAFVELLHNGISTSLETAAGSEKAAARTSC